MSDITAPLQGQTLLLTQTLVPAFTGPPPRLPPAAFGPGPFVGLLALVVALLLLRSFRAAREWLLEDLPRRGGVSGPSPGFAGHYATLVLSLLVLLLLASGVRLLRGF